MLLSIVIPLTALNTLERPAFLGREAHALFLDLVQHASPALAAQLHADEQRKPFTVSGVQPTDPRRFGDRAGLKEGESYFVRVTSLSAELSCALLESVLPHLPTSVRLGEAHFEVQPPLSEATQHSWAGQSSAEVLMAKWFGASEPPARQVELHFVSPTAIKRQGRLLVTPSPAAIFQSYLMAWNAYGSPPFENDLSALVERDVLVTRYDLRTQSVLQTRGDAQALDAKYTAHQIGFVGRCAFTCFRPERALWRTLHLLADFAFYCGTGYKTTQGMGQTRRVLSASSGRVAGGRER